MKQTDKDILKDFSELRQMPFGTPDGYFESFRRDARRPQTEVVSLWSRLRPFASVAAAFIFLVTAGTLILERTARETGLTQEDYLLFSDNFTLNTVYQEDVQIADAAIQDEDIIEYLIFTGISAEEIELSK